MAADPPAWRRRVVGSCLYGVDINPLAVELAKLSLWLTTVERGRPLSFLDHHLRCGDSLIGARLEDLPVTALADTLRSEAQPTASGPKDQLTIFDLPAVQEEMAQAARGALTLETEPEETPDDVHAKATRYAALRRELQGRYGLIADLAVARHLGLDLDDNTFRRLVRGYLDGDQAYVPRFAADMVRQSQRIAQDHRFFHWQLEFAQVLYPASTNGGDPKHGFQAVIGNPPYVGASRGKFTSGRYRTAGCGNLYALMVERALEVDEPGAALGFIVPISIVCTRSMDELRALLEDGCKQLVLGHFGIRPAKIFPEVDQRVTIAVCRKADARGHPCSIWSSRLNRWNTGEHLEMLAALSHVDVSGLPRTFGWPKIGDATGVGLAEKLHDKPRKVGDLLAGTERFYYHGIGRYWLKAYDFVPLFERNGELGRSSTLVEIPVGSHSIAQVLISIVNSSLFYWYWTSCSDLFHLRSDEIAQFPLFGQYRDETAKAALAPLCDELMADYKAHSSVRGNSTRYQEFYPRKSKQIIDRIDDVLGELYNLTPEEVEYVKTYDLEYRTD